jgi:uncharacterized protein YeeX (DUF496 family)
LLVAATTACKGGRGGCFFYNGEQIMSTIQEIKKICDNEQAILMVTNLIDYINLLRGMTDDKYVKQNYDLIKFKMMDIIKCLS